jgi:hypothetical protein
MRRISGIFCLSLWCGAAAMRGDYQFKAPDWTIEAQFAAPPSTDAILTPSAQGDVKASRYFLEQAGERSMLIRFAYPMAMMPGEETGVYDKSIGELMRSRPGKLRTRDKYQLGPYEGERLVIAQPKEKTIRELRLLVIGSSLYVMSAEWPAQGTGAARAEKFFGGVRLRADSTDLRVVEERERWREFALGNFKLRLDATRWYRDPADQEPGIFNFLRTDQKAEAQFIAEEHPAVDGDIERAVLTTAREGAESVSVKRHGKKLRGAVQVIELEFEARVENATYLNHGYFYSGPEGAVQLRAWAKEVDYQEVSGDMGELLDGLTVSAAPALH